MQQAAITREARGKEKNETVEENDGKLMLKSEELRLFRKKKKEKRGTSHINLQALQRIRRNTQTSSFNQSGV